MTRALLQYHRRIKVFSIVKPNLNLARGSSAIENSSEYDIFFMFCDSV